MQSNKIKLGKLGGYWVILPQILFIVEELL